MTTADAWIVAAEWADSSPTYYGPFTFAEDAENWASEHLNARFELAILTPPYREES